MISITATGKSAWAWGEADILEKSLVLREMSLDSAAARRCLLEEENQKLAHGWRLQLSLAALLSELRAPLTTTPPADRGK